MSAPSRAVFLRHLRGRLAAAAGREAPAEAAGGAGAGAGGAAATPTSAPSSSSSSSPASILAWGRKTATHGASVASTQPPLRCGFPPLLRPICTASAASWSAASAPGGAWGGGARAGGAAGGAAGGSPSAVAAVAAAGGGEAPTSAAASNPASSAAGDQRRSLASAAHAQQAEYDDADLLAEDAGLGLMGGGADLAPPAPSLLPSFPGSSASAAAAASAASLPSLWPRDDGNGNITNTTNNTTANTATAATTDTVGDAAVRAVLDRMSAASSAAAQQRLSALAREVAAADVAVADPVLAPPGLAAQLREHERRVQEEDRGIRRRSRRSPPAGSAAAADPAAAHAASPAAALLTPASDGEVRAPAGSLYGAMVEHYLALREASPKYTDRVPFGEFARRYVEQLRLEERSRTRAAEDLDRALARDAASGKPGAGAGAQRGRATASLIATWQPLLAQAIAQEQAEVQLAAGGGRGSGGGGGGAGGAASAAVAAAKRDRANYGPYLLVLDPDELATITIQCVLNRIAASVHAGTDDPDDGGGLLLPPPSSSLSRSGGNEAAADADDPFHLGTTPTHPVVASSAARGARPPGMGTGGSATGIITESMSAPAVALAEMVGRAANERVMLVHRNARLREAAARRRRQRAVDGGAGGGGNGAAAGSAGGNLALSSSSSPPPLSSLIPQHQPQHPHHYDHPNSFSLSPTDPATLWAARASAALEDEAEAAGLALPPDVAARVVEIHAEAERRHAALEAARGRLRDVAADPRAPYTYRAAAADAARSVRWDPDARLRVGAALVALLVENAPVPVPGARMDGGGGWEEEGQAAATAMEQLPQQQQQGGAGGPPPEGWRWDEDGLGAAAAAAGAPFSSSSSSFSSSAFSSSSDPVALLHNSSSSQSGPPTSTPAFDYSYVRLGLKRQAFVRATPSLVDALGRDRSALAALAAKAPPMLIPPRPWASHNVGGYLTSSHWMMRTRWSWHVKEALRRGSARGQFPAVLDALNALGSTPWRVNAPVYEALRALWRSKRTDGGLPRQDPHPMPPPPTTAFRLAYSGGASGGAAGGGSLPGGAGAGGSQLLAFGGAPTPLERRQHRLALDEARRANRNAASLRADFEIKLRVAEEVATRPEVFYPHTLDFRGRAYPIHAALQHLGDDVSRGLLCFAEPKPLGSEGLAWLYVHLANVWGHGVDKRPFDARREFVRDHLPQVLASARDPLGEEERGGQVDAADGTWWTRAEKPWQALAACCEVAAALAHPDGPAAFGSRLPVHMDGSCNGLQHYAALGRDEAGGKAVNLMPSDAPQDVYSGVARLVARRVAADAALATAAAAADKGAAAGSGGGRAASLSSSSSSSTAAALVGGARGLSSSAALEEEQEGEGENHDDSSSLFAAAAAPPPALNASPAHAALAARLVGQIDRKLVKQTVMTSVYGVTAIGAREQVEARLRERGWAAGDPHRRELLFRASRYVANHTLDALAEMFGNARRIMAWLAECARLVADRGEPVRWRNPLGLPVAQPYHQSGSTPVHTLTQAFSVQREDGDRAAAVAKGRQRTAFPPNYIHSVDSAHMMRTALACSREGVTFAGVHDSFWTHAGDVTAMAALLREEFASLHGGGGGGEGGKGGSGNDLLADLRAQLVEAYPGVDFPPVPARGDLDVSEVRKSRYFFS